MGPHAARRLPVDLVFPLVGQWVVLQNLSTADAAELAAIWHPSLFQNMLDWPDDDTPDGTRAYLRRLLRRPGIRAYVVRVRQNLAPAGITGLVDLRPVHRCAEVCCTLLLPPYRGTVVFPETMLLLLGLAFDVLHLPRVRWRTSVANLAARAALDKLGATVESFHPAADVARDGRVHDTLVYRLLHTEWPAARDRLHRRCASAGVFAPTPSLHQATALAPSPVQTIPPEVFRKPGAPS
ncbi:MAG: GNAT family protein [Armatimonadota bacterium]|nr:GNAT family N-acetyltransferase [Armatimonadota bacterium]MDW8156481.1 GNAT family protein [Armatimonadota bacterium]